VKHWITLNEPWSYSNNGYAIGTFAPGRCTKWLDPTCLGGDSGREPYIVTHNLLLAHAAAVDVYNKKFRVCLAFTRTFKSLYIVFRFPHCYEEFKYSGIAVSLTLKTLYTGL